MKFAAPLPTRTFVKMCRCRRLANSGSHIEGQIQELEETLKSAGTIGAEKKPALRLSIGDTVTFITSTRVRNSVISWSARARWTSIEAGSQQPRRLATPSWGAKKAKS